MSGPLTADEAIGLLHKSPGAYTTPDQLRTLAARVNADAMGRLTVLYSGGVGKGAWSTDVIEGMTAAGEDVRVINKSEAAKFMTSEAFNRAIAKSHGILLSQLEDKNYRGPAKEWLHHPTQGPWADASARFAELTKGEVRAIVPGADPKRTFGAVELPRVIANPQVTTIEDIPRQTLEKVVAEKGLQPAFEMTVAKSHENVGTLRAAANASGMTIKGDNGALLLDSRTYLHGTPAQARTPTSTAITRSMGDLMGPPDPVARAGQVHLQTWQAQIALDTGVPPLRPAAGLSGATVLRGASVVGGIAAFGYEGYTAVRETANLLDQNNLIGAQSRIVRFGVQSAGALTGATLGASAGGALGGAPGAVIGGLAGGVAGGVAGDKVTDAMDQSRIYTQRGSDGHQWRFDEKQGWSRPPRPGEFGPQGPPSDLAATAGMTYNSQTRLLHAGPRLADELNYKASSADVELALARAPALKPPFTQPAGPGDAFASQATPWTRDPDTRQWSRFVADPTQAAMGNPAGSTEQASRERSAELDTAAQTTIAENLTYSRPAIAQRYQDAYDQYGWKQHGLVPAAVTTAAETAPSQQQTQTRAPFEQAQLRRFEAEPRLTPTPGGMSFAEAHKRRDEPEQISPGSLQPVGKLDASQMNKGSKLYRVHQAQEQDLMRGLGIAMAQDRERFKNEPAPGRQQPSVERTQERAQRHLPEETQMHEPVVRPVPAVEAPQSLAPSQPLAEPAAAAIAEAQARAAAAQAELAEMRQQIARMTEQRRHDGLERRDERGERDQRETQQVAQSHDTPQIFATAVADASRPLMRHLSDPSHPQNALYSTLKDVLPQGTSEERLAQCTATCHRSRITAKELSGVHIGDKVAVFVSHSPFSVVAHIDISQPVPGVAQSEQQLQQYDQQRAQMMSDMRAQNAQINQQQGPMPGGLSAQ